MPCSLYVVFCIEMYAVRMRFDGVTFITDVLEIASLLRKLKKEWADTGYCSPKFAYFAKGREIGQKWLYKISLIDLIKLIYYNNGGKKFCLLKVLEYILYL